jgi:hypothetical protein
MSCPPQKVIVTESAYAARLTVYHGETWYDPLPQLVDPVSGDPFDLTDVTIEFILRPSAQHTTRFALLRSGGSGIVKESAINGLAAVVWPQTSVETYLPLSPSAGNWWHMQRLTWIDPVYGSIKKILAEGPLFVRPARDNATL